MSKGGDEVQETASQRALAQYATEQMADYKARWLPVQKKLAAQIQSMGKPDSAARHLAKGRADTDTAIQFSQAQGALEKSLANSGGVGSSRGKLAIAGLGTDQARSRGLGAMIADQQIDDAYTQGLTALMQQGRGERATVSNSMADMAASSARQAASDAEAALEERSGNAQLAGRFAGLAAQQAFKPNVPVADTGRNAYSAGNGDTRRFNNPSAYVPPGYPE